MHRDPSPNSEEEASPFAAPEAPPETAEDKAAGGGTCVDSSGSGPQGLSRRAAGLTVLVAVLMSLATTADPVFNQRTQDFYADSPDSVNIADWASRSTLHDALRWWYGPWIQRTGYYRPLSSWIIWLEYLLAGRSFQAFCAVSWLLHALNGALLALLALALFRHRPWSWAWALLAVALFNYRLGPAGPSWQPWPVAIGVVAWWPAQTDELSLATGLGALLLLDRYARQGRRADATWASVLCLASLLSKEMAVALPLLGAGLLGYRRAWRSWRVPAAWAGMAAGMLLVRAMAVPQASGPSLAHFWPPYVARKLVWYSFERLYSYVDPAGAGEYWMLVAAAATVGLVYLLWRLRLSVVWMLLVCVLVPPLVAQVMFGNFALVTVPREQYGLLTAFLFVLGLVVLLRLGTREVWWLLTMVVAVHLPILHVLGPHYWYWPAAFWGLFGACLTSLALERLSQVLRQPPFAAPRPATADVPEGSERPPDAATGGGEESV